LKKKGKNQTVLEEFWWGGRDELTIKSQKRKGSRPASSQFSNRENWGQGDLKQGKRKKMRTRVQIPRISIKLDKKLNTNETIVGFTGGTWAERSVK